MTTSSIPFRRSVLLLTAALALAGCAGNAARHDGISGEITDAVHKVATPEQWRDTLQQVKAKDNWLASFHDPQLTALVSDALAHNFQLKQQALAVDIKQQQILAAGSALWPELAAKLVSNRRKSVSPDALSNSHSLSLDLSYEIDLWGKLSANEQRANLEWLTQQANFRQAEQSLVADVTTAWYGAVSAAKLLQLAEQRADNTKENLSIIESGYQQGLNTALDVYLTRNELNSALARVSEQALQLTAAKRRLQSLLGSYPSGDLAVASQVASISGQIPLGLPSDIIQRKPALQASWYQLLAKDAALAFAHKQRFPSLSLSASLSDSQSDIGKLLSGSPLAWSLLGNLTAPIFQAGRLKSNEQQARLILQQSEQDYLATLYDAFATAENAISTERSLQQRLELQQQAKVNAEAAYKLSFENYRHGLVTYTTVLDAQNRWYDAQSTVIQLNNQLVSNRVQLYVALGGNFAESRSAEK